MLKLRRTEDPYSDMLMSKGLWPDFEKLRAMKEMPRSKDVSFQGWSTLFPVSAQTYQKPVNP